MKFNLLDSSKPQFQKKLDVALDSYLDYSSIDKTVATILNNIKQRGDKSLIFYSQKFDNFKFASPDFFVITKPQLKKFEKKIPANLLLAIKAAHKRVTNFHKKQISQSFTFKDDLGNEMGQKIVPIESVGVYVPGGTAAYPSSVIMNVVPAKVAGVERIVMVTPSKDGKVNDTVMAAASVAGVDVVYTIGGAQAIGALTFGTKTIKKVDKIVGPGNAYVASAKKQVFGTVGIDMIAGPSEIVVISDGDTPARWIASDLFSQAEHDTNSRSILISTSKSHLKKVFNEMQILINSMPRKKIIMESITNNGLFIYARNLKHATEIANEIAPEHLEISTRNPKELLNNIKNAGAVFLGKFTSEALGDYCAGPNHVLPTSGTAKFSSGLSVDDFIKKINVLRITKTGARKLSNITNTIALSEGLYAHGYSAMLRK